MVAAAEWDQLKSNLSDLEGPQLERLRILEDLLDDTDRHVLHGMSAAEAEDVWQTVHKTGDPLGDYWEYRIVHGLITEQDWNLNEPPPRDEWDDPGPTVN